MNCDELIIDILKHSSGYWNKTIKIMFMKHTLPIFTIICKLQNKEISTSILWFCMTLDLKSFDKVFYHELRDELLKIIIKIMTKNAELKILGN